jgi:hypothetical protein
MCGGDNQHTQSSNLKYCYGYGSNCYGIPTLKPMLTSYNMVFGCHSLSILAHNHSTSHSPMHNALVENMVKKNRSRFPITVLLTTILARVAPNVKSLYSWSFHWLSNKNTHEYVPLPAMQKNNRHVKKNCIYAHSEFNSLYIIFI